MRDLPLFLSRLGDVPVVTDPELVRRRSRDMTAHFSPVMKQEALAHAAEVLVRPRDQADVVRIASAAARARMPLVMRGAGTCNFGQGIPLAGGALVDMTALDQVLWTRPGRVRAQAGARMHAMDEATRPQGWELRMHPSTRRSATIGGFVAGGHAGVGSCAWGILRDRGNLLGLQVVSVEEEPRIVELAGDDVNLVHHAYGSNGIITEVELPLAPAWDWREHVVLFPEFMQAVRCAHALAASDGIVRKLVTVWNGRTASLVKAMQGCIDPASDGVVLAMVAEPFLEAFEALVREFGGRIVSRCAEGQGAYNAPLYEFAWGHTRLHANRTQPDLVMTVGLYLDPDAVGTIERTWRRLRESAGMHFEVKRFDGQLGFQGMPLFSWQGEAHLADLMRGMADDGAQVANNHTFLVKEGGMKPVEGADARFKREMDPYGLMNPGKMATAETQSETQGTALPSEGWKFRKAA